MIKILQNRRGEPLDEEEVKAMYKVSSSSYSPGLQRYATGCFARVLSSSSRVSRQSRTVKSTTRPSLISSPPELKKNSLPHKFTSHLIDAVKSLTTSLLYNQTSIAIADDSPVRTTRHIAKNKADFVFKSQSMYCMTGTLS